MNASYLFQKDKHYDVRYDTGDKAIQCGRQVDILKIWLMWSAKVIRKYLLKIVLALFYVYELINLLFIRVR